MALSATCQFEVEFGGNDSANGGFFDPSQTAGMNTDGAATVANTASPIFTSASYNFVAGDVGAWLFIASGSNWTPGWYKIVSVASNAATLDATVGQYVTYVASTVQMALSNSVNNAAGCATVASPTAATWSIDYSQQSGAQFTYTDFTTAGSGATATSSVHPFGKQQVGNGIQLTGGTNITTGFFTLKSVSGTTGTFDRNVSTGASSNGAGGMGGALLTLNAATLQMQTSNRCWIQYNATAVAMSSAPTMTPGTGTGLVQTRFTGYNTYRGDDPKGSGRPTIQSTGSATNMLALPNYTIVEYLILDCNSVASSTGISSAGGFMTARNCLVKNFKTRGIYCNGPSAMIDQCEVTGGVSGSTAAISVPSGGSASSIITNCYVHDNACLGVDLSGAPGSSIVNSIIYNNTGSNSYGIKVANSTVLNCVIYGNAGHNIYTTGTAVLLGGIYRNNIIVTTASGTYGFYSNNAFYADSSWDGNAYFNNGGSGNRFQIGSGIQDIILTGNPFVSVPTNWGLNTTTGAGAACRQAGIPSSPAGLPSTVAYLDQGAIQSGTGVGGGEPVQLPLTGGIVG